MSPEEQERVRRNFSGVALIVLCLFALLFLRLWFLQLVQGEEMQQRSEHNRIRLQDLPPWRGMILDHNGQVLVANRPSYELVVVMEDVGDIPLLARRLASLLHLDPQQLTGPVGKRQESRPAPGADPRATLPGRKWPGWTPYQPELPGVLVQIQPKREYRQKGMACHVLGYLGEINEAQLKSGKFANYKMGDYLGRCGVELAWEKYLRGARGYRRIEVDAYGREFGQLDWSSPPPGPTSTSPWTTGCNGRPRPAWKARWGPSSPWTPAPARSWPWPPLPPFPRRPLNGGSPPRNGKGSTKDKTHPLENRALQGPVSPGFHL